ncbi:MAG: serA 3 [Planctomycetaceae bacterium]|nr:serA 3 [Planctomycetaceae bacterium]
MSKVLIAPAAFYRVPGPYVRLLQEAGLEVVYPPAADPRTEADTLSCLQGVSAIIAGGEFLNEKLLSQLPDLRVIARAGVGYDRVDIPAATKHNIAVTITPNANHESVAEHAMGLLLALSRNIVGHHQDVLDGDWSRRPMVPLRGLTLGLVGLGRIGRSVAVRAQAFRLRVIAHDLYVDPELAKRLNVELVDLPTLFAQSDYVSLHAPMTESTSGLINRKTLALMKPGSFLINTSRGGLVVEDDLSAALHSRHLAGAALDVFDVEPTPVTNPLLQSPNLILTPHLASGDYQSMEDMGTESATNIIALYQGGWPEGAVVNEQIRPTFRW